MNIINLNINDSLFKREIKIKNFIYNYPTTEFIRRLISDSNFYKKILSEISKKELINGLYEVWLRDKNSFGLFEIVKLVNTYNLNITIKLFKIFIENLNYEDVKTIDCKNFISFTINYVAKDRYYNYYLEKFYKVFKNQLTKKQKEKICNIFINRNIDVDIDNLSEELICKKTIYDLKNLDFDQYIKTLKFRPQLYNTSNIFDWEYFINNVNAKFNKSTCKEIFKNIIDKDLTCFQYFRKFEHLIFILNKLDQKEIDQLYIKYLNNTKTSKLSILSKSPSMEIGPELYFKYQEFLKNNYTLSLTQEKLKNKIYKLIDTKSKKVNKIIIEKEWETFEDIYSNKSDDEILKNLYSVSFERFLHCILDRPSFYICNQISFLIMGYLGYYIKGIKGKDLTQYFYIFDFKYYKKFFNENLEYIEQCFKIFKPYINNLYEPRFTIDEIINLNEKGNYENFNFIKLPDFNHTIRYIRKEGEKYGYK